MRHGGNIQKMNYREHEIVKASINHLDKYLVNNRVDSRYLALRNGAIAGAGTALGVTIIVELGLIGALVGSIAPGIGTAIGAGVGIVTGIVIAGITYMCVEKRYEINNFFFNMFAAVCEKLGFPEKAAELRGDAERFEEVIILLEYLHKDISDALAVITNFSYKDEYEEFRKKCFDAIFDMENPSTEALFHENASIFKEKPEKMGAIQRSIFKNATNVRSIILNIVKDGAIPVTDKQCIKREKAERLNAFLKDNDKYQELLKVYTGAMLFYAKQSLEKTVDNRQVYTFTELCIEKEIKKHECVLL